MLAFIPAASFAQTVPPGRRAGEDPPWTLDQVQALYPNYDCLLDVVAGYWLVLASLPGSGYTGWHVAEYQLYAGDVVVYLVSPMYGALSPARSRATFGSCGLSGMRLLLLRISVSMGKCFRSTRRST